MPLGRVSRGQLWRALNTSCGMLMRMGQACTQRMHMVHIHTQGVEVTSSSMPRAAMRRNLRGSMSSSPEAGQPAVHAPQVRHRSRLPPSGSSAATRSLKVFPPGFSRREGVMVVSGITGLQMIGGRGGGGPAPRGTALQLHSSWHYFYNNNTSDIFFTKSYPSMCVSLWKNRLLP